MIRSSSSTRTWAIVSVVGGALALIGFFVPWFFSTGTQSVEFTVSGWRLFLAVPSATQSPATFIVVLLPLVTFLAAFGVLVAGFCDLAGRQAPWLTRLQLVAPSLGLLYLAMGVGVFEILFHALTNFDTANPDVALIPGVGVWLMFLGFVAALIADIRSHRTRSLSPATT